MAEKKTEISFERRLKELGYPQRDISNGDLKVWSQTEFSTSSEVMDKYFTSAWAHASKQKGKNGPAKPEYTIRNINSDLVIVVECKPRNEQHCSVDNFEDIRKEEFKQKIQKKQTTSRYALDGALHYASFIKDSYNVLVVAVSGHIEVDKDDKFLKNGDYRLTSFLWKKGTELKDIILKDDGEYLETFDKYDTYLEYTKSLSPIFLKKKDDLRAELTMYANRCNSFLRKNDINPEVRVSYIAGCLIALEDKDFRTKVRKSYEFDSEMRITAFTDMIDTSTSDLVNNAQKKQWNKLPPYKKGVLEKHYKNLYNTYGNDPVKYLKNGFDYGANVLSTLVHSLYLNVYIKKEEFTGIDIMGQFYTAFLKYAKSDASDKSIVLTPKHITDLFCDLAEHYLNRKLDDTITVLDICCGTGSFLISAMERMFFNIENDKKNIEEQKNRKERVKEECLIGIEKNINMYALAYSNMNFHGDGKSNLYYGSSLLSDEENYKLDMDKTTSISLLSKVREHNALVGFINPPYSLDSDTKDSVAEKKRKREIELKLFLEHIEKFTSENNLEENLLKDLKKIKDEIDKRNDDIDNFSDKKNDIKEIKKKLQELNIIGDSKVLSKTISNIYKQEDNTKEIDFVASMLSCINKDGIGIVIMPMACGSKEDKKRAKLLETNTLLAVMSMPSKLFYESDVSTVTSIYVFKVGTPHNEYFKDVEDEEGTFFSRWVDDGYRVIPHNGRCDFDNKHNWIKKQWFREIKRFAKADDTKWLYKKINPSEEWCPEAYVKTDYSILTEEDFVNTLKKYELFLYMQENELNS